MDHPQTVPRPWLAGPRAAWAAWLLLAVAVASEAQPAQEPDHGLYAGLLAKYVDPRGMVNYREWRRRDRPSLQRYLAGLSAVDPERLSRNQKLAFYINLYNALTIDGILHFYPLRSIKDKVSTLLGYNIWDDYRTTINGRELSLNDIEHKILRPLGEPRIHFAIVCASISCPRLLSEPYTGDRLDHQLGANSRDFFGSKGRFRIDRAARKVYLSPILDWFGQDFGGTTAAKLAFIAPLVPPADRPFLAQPGLQIEYLDYDWGLNEQR